jgi:4-hydroxybenzoate polyprenyltransferase
MNIKAILKTLKINHYIKNIIVFIPIIFSLNINNPKLWLLSTLMFITFCLISSAVYIMNDLSDIEKDKIHPTKCNRPIASGKISKLLAITIMIILIILSFLIAGKLNILCLTTIISYLILNILYTFWLKKIPIIDATCIASGFILRVISGCFAISVSPSALVILLTFFTSLFFTYTKRKLELQYDKNSQRKSIQSLSIDTADKLILINAILSIAFYFTYVLDSNTIQRAGTEYLYITVIPFTLIIYRLLFLINTIKIDDDPIHYLERDNTIKALICVYILVLALVMIF